MSKYTKEQLDLKQNGHEVCLNKNCERCLNTQEQNLYPKCTTTDHTRFSTYFELPNYLMGENYLSDGYFRISINFDGRPFVEFKTYANQAALCISLEQLKNVSNCIINMLNYLEEHPG